MSLLTIVQNAADRLNITRPTSVINNTNDQNAIVFLAVANEEGKELSRRASWQRLTKERTFLALAQEEQTGALPADFDRMLPDTFFNRTQKRYVLGPLSQQDWQAQKALTTNLLFDSFRIRGNTILMNPVPVLNDQYAFEYVSNLFVDTNADGTGDASAWANDADTSVLDEELLTLGIIWRFRRSQRLDFTEHYQFYESQVNQAVGRDGARTVVQLSRRAMYDRSIYPAIPEGNWNI